MVSRFREAISAGHDGPAASVIAARQAGRTLLISASTVAIGFLALLTVPISEIRSIGVAGFLVAGMSVLLTNTLVPAVLALLGPRIDAGRLPFTPRLDADRAARTGNRWRQWGKVIVAHPWLAICSGRRSVASARLAGHAAGYQPAQRGLASAGGGIGPCAPHPGTDGSGRRCSIVARHRRTANGFHRANRRGLECARSSHQAPRERPSLRPRDFYHNDCGGQPVFPQ